MVVVCVCAVKEIDLALWRSAEDVANDKREFMNDGEWELLSIPSRYRHIQQDATDYAQIQFNASVWSCREKRSSSSVRSSPDLQPLLLLRGS